MKKILTILFLLNSIFLVSCWNINNLPKTEKRVKYSSGDISVWTGSKEAEETIKEIEDILDDIWS